MFLVFSRATSYAASDCSIPRTCMSPGAGSLVTTQSSFLFKTAPHRLLFVLIYITELCYTNGYSNRGALVKTSILWRVFVTLSLVLGLASLANSLWAQADPATGLNGKGKKAYSIPISDKRIQFQVTLPSGYTATMRVQEGGMAKLLAFNAGFAYALVPVTRGV